MHSATIIIPTLNEGKNIDPLLDQLSRLTVKNCTIEILFVDDQSNDNTIEKIQHWQQSQQNIHYLSRTSKPDLTQSVIDGAHTCTTDFIVVMDADLSHPIDRIPALLAPLIEQTNDIVVGSRYVKDGGAKSWPLKRRLLSWIGGLPARILTDVKDTTSGFFACKAECFSQVSNNAKGYKILIEILASGLGQYRACEIPITFTDRVHGESKLSSKQISEYLQRLTQISGYQFNVPSFSLLFCLIILGAIVDFFSYQFLTDANLTLSSAHLGSFFIAGLSFVIFNSLLKRINPKQAIDFNTIAWAWLFAVLVRVAILSVNSQYLTHLHCISLAILVPIIILALSFIVKPYIDHSVIPQVKLCMSWRILTLLSIIFTIALKVIFINNAQLIPDEAYYWNYQEHLSLSYLDHPPLLAWTIWISTFLFGDTEFAVRLFPLGLGLGVMFFIFKTSALLFDKSTAYIAAFIPSVLPITFATGYFATTDAFIMFFWAACLYLIVQIFKNNSKHAWILLGLGIGLGMLSKYTIATLVASCIIFVLFATHRRRWLSQPIVYIAAIISLFVFMPVIYWNYENDWSSFLFQSTRRLDRENSFSTHYLFLHVLILLTPVFLYLFFKATINLNALCSNLKTALEKRDYLHYYLVFTFVPLSIFIYFSISHYPRFHWTAPIWLAGIPFIAYLISPTNQINYAQLSSRLVKYTGVFLCLFYLVIFNMAAFGPYTKTSPQYADHYFWEEVARAIHAVELQTEARYNKKPVIVGLSKWSIASSLRFYDQDGYIENILSRNAIGKSATMYETWTDPTQWQGRPVIFVAINPNDLDATLVHQHSRNLQPVQSRAIILNGIMEHENTTNASTARTLHYRIADQYSP